MTSTFDINEHYSIELSLNTHENHIYILTVNKTSNKSYENIIRPSDIMNYTFNIESIHKIIVKCFDTDENTDYTFNINCYGDSIKLSFNVLLDKYLKINFDICLTEKKLSSNDELLINFNKMNIKLIELEKIITEQRNLFTNQQKQIINLENNLSNCVVNLIHKLGANHVLGANGKYEAYALLVPINLCELNFRKFDNIHDYYYYIDYEIINHLYKLKKLTLYLPQYHFSTSLVKSKTVEHLTIYGHHYGSNVFHSRTIPKEFTGLEYFPNLKHLCMISSYFNSSSFVGNLKSFKHNIKKIEMINCRNHNNLELENYCRNNKIEIIFQN